MNVEVLNVLLQRKLSQRLQGSAQKHQEAGIGR